MNTEERRRSLGDALEALSRGSVAEMLREMGASLGKLAGCAYLSPVQERHIGRFGACRERSTLMFRVSRLTAPGATHTM